MPILTPRSVSVPLSNGLVGTLTEDRSPSPEGGTVTYTITLLNPTTQPITYQPLLDPDALIVNDPTGSLAYPLFAAIPNVIGIGPSTTLAPGQSTTAEIQTVGNTDAGRYSLAGPYSAKTSFSLVQGVTATSAGTVVSASTGPLTVLVQ